MNDLSSLFLNYNQVPLAQVHMPTPTFPAFNGSPLGPTQLDNKLSDTETYSSFSQSTKKIIQSILSIKHNSIVLDAQVLDKERAGLGWLHHLLSKPCSVSVSRPIKWSSVSISQCPEAVRMRHVDKCSAGHPEHSNQRSAHRTCDDHDLDGDHRRSQSP